MPGLGRDPDLGSSAEHELRFTDFVETTTVWRHYADDVAGVEHACAQRDDRWFDAPTTFEGTLDLRGWLDPLNGAIVDNELRRLEQRLFDADWAEARERVGPDARPTDLARTPTQRRADALVEMAIRSAAMPAGAKQARVLVTILWGAESFRDRMCETDRGVAIHPDHVVPHLFDADIERIVFGAGSRVMDVGVRERFFTGALRRAIEVRDRHCAHPAGCDVPAPDCQVDHIVDYALGGPTTQDNGRLLCAVHNRTKQRRGPPTRAG